MDKKTPKSDFGPDDEAYLRKLLAAMSLAVTTRGTTGTFGEIHLKITQEKGKIRSAKILEESIMRPNDPP